MRPPPLPVLYAIGHGAGAIAIVAGAMALAGLLPALIGAIAVPVIVGVIGVVAWIVARWSSAHRLPAANDNDPCSWPQSFNGSWPQFISE